MPRKKRATVSPQEKLDELRAYFQNYVKMSEAGFDVTGEYWIDYYRLILERGTPFLTRTLSNKYPEVKKWKSRRRPKAKECYYNAQMLVLDLDGKDCRYFEGFAFSQIIPFPHGWVVMADGNVVDVTLDAIDAKPGSVPEETVYLGVPLPFKAVCRFIAKFEESGPFANLHYLKAKHRLML